MLWLHLFYDWEVIQEITIYSYTYQVTSQVRIHTREISILYGIRVFDWIQDMWLQHRRDYEFIWGICDIHLWAIQFTRYAQGLSIFIFTNKKLNKQKHTNTTLSRKNIFVYESEGFRFQFITWHLLCCLL